MFDSEIRVKEIARYVWAHTELATSKHVPLYALQCKNVLRRRSQRQRLTVHAQESVRHVSYDRVLTSDGGIVKQILGPQIQMITHDLKLFFVLTRWFYNRNEHMYSFSWTLQFGSSINCDLSFKELVLCRYFKKIVYLWNFIEDTLFEW